MHFKNRLKAQEVLKARAQQRQKAALLSAAAWGWEEDCRSKTFTFIFSKSLGSDPRRCYTQQVIPKVGANIAKPHSPRGVAFFFISAISKATKRSIKPGFSGAWMGLPSATTQRQSLRDSPTTAALCGGWRTCRPFTDWTCRRHHHWSLIMLIPVTGFFHMPMEMEQHAVVQLNVTEDAY